MTDLLPQHLPVELHRLGVGVDLHPRHLGAIMAGVDVEGDYPGLLRLDGCAQLVVAALELVELALLYPDWDMKMNGPDIASSCRPVVSR